MDSRAGSSMGERAEDAFNELMVGWCSPVAVEVGTPCKDVIT